MTKEITTPTPNEVVKQDDVMRALPANASTPMDLIQIAIQSESGIDTLERMMAMQEKWEARQAEKDFNDAMAELQSEMPTIKKKKKGHNCLYAPLEDIIAQVGHLIHKHGFSYRFETQALEGAIQITCVVKHRNGHSERTTMDGPYDTSGGKNSIQSAGSSFTYLKRYTFQGAFGIATADEDMDGRIASMHGDILSDNQLANLEALIGEVSANRQAFLKFLRVKDLKDLPASKYNDAVRALEDKRK